MRRKGIELALQLALYCVNIIERFIRIFLTLRKSRSKFMKKPTLSNYLFIKVFELKMMSYFNCYVPYLYTYIVIYTTLSQFKTYFVHKMLTILYVMFGIIWWFLYSCCFSKLDSRMWGTWTKNFLKGAHGVEPWTSRSAVECSTTELYPLTDRKH